MPSNREKALASLRRANMVRRAHSVALKDVRGRRTLSERLRAAASLVGCATNNNALLRAIAVHSLFDALKCLGRGRADDRADLVRLLIHNSGIGHTGRTLGSLLDSERKNLIMELERLAENREANRGDITTRDRLGWSEEDATSTAIEARSVAEQRVVLLVSEIRRHRERTGADQFAGADERLWAAAERVAARAGVP